MDNDRDRHYQGIIRKGFAHAPARRDAILRRELESDWRQNQVRGRWIARLAIALLLVWLLAIVLGAGWLVTAAMRYWGQP
ncbi:MAG: hypothetical protein KDI44_14265 [Thiothrix sp.]|nr:hypothetical protein [Thiothrix sp.]HPQ94966.1 hypothetical protein [Thiolinea sp.]